MEAASPTPGLQITIKPITSEVDLPDCARISDIALKTDPLHEFKARYGISGVYLETLDRLTESLRDERGRFRLFKAVVSLPLAQGEETKSETDAPERAETIVGFTHWRYGYVEVPKYDPFAPQKGTEKDPGFETGVTNVALAGENGQRTHSATPPSHEVESVSTPGPAKSEKSKPFYRNPHDELGRKLGNAYIGTIRGKRHLCK